MLTEKLTHNASSKVAILSCYHDAENPEGLKFSFAAIKVGDLGWLYHAFVMVAVELVPFIRQAKNASLRSEFHPVKVNLRPSNKRTLLVNFFTSSQPSGHCTVRNSRPIDGRTE